MRLVILAMFSLFFPCIACTQDSLESAVNKELGFINHCISIEEYQNAIYLVDHFELPLSLNFIADTLNYLKGWSYYQINELDSSVIYLSKVRDLSFVYPKSQFYSAFIQANTGKIDEGIIRLQKSLINSDLYYLRDIELAGMYLLKRDFDSFEVISSRIKGSNYPFAKEIDDILKYQQQINDFKQKSMFVAGALSAILPGAGKVYSSRLGEGISAFLFTSSIGLVAIENIRKDGILDPKSLFFTGVFSLFYIGNIWGSVFSVQMQREEFNHEINHNILFDLHIPLRRVFN